MNDLQSRNHSHHRAKADVYRLLSACFYQPEDAFLEEDVFGQLKMALAETNPECVQQAVTLDDCFRSSGADALVLDYSRLFLGPFEILAKPYGSVYLDDKKVIMGDSTLQAMALYREGGFQLGEDFREMPDHVAVELEFLYQISFQLGQAETVDGRIALSALKQRFLTEHLGRWIGPFTEAIRTAAETDFYKQLASLAERIINEEMLELKEIA